MISALKKPYFVDELVVYMETPERALVAELDCRVELVTTPSSCTCCTYRFYARRTPGYRCRHITAVIKVIEGQGKEE